MTYDEVISMEAGSDDSSVGSSFISTEGEEERVREVVGGEVVRVVGVVAPTEGTVLAGVVPCLTL